MSGTGLRRHLSQDSYTCRAPAADDRQIPAVQSRWDAPATRTDTWRCGYSTISLGMSAGMALISAAAGGQSSGLAREYREAPSATYASARARLSPRCELSAARSLAVAGAGQRSVAAYRRRSRSVALLYLSAVPSSASWSCGSLAVHERGQQEAMSVFHPAISWA
jgi:hypothetical protein